MAEQELIVLKDEGGEQFLTVASGLHMKAVEVYTGPDGVEKIIADIEREVKTFVPDLSTVKSRALIASKAYQVSQSKVLLFNLGKSLTADWKAKAKKVDEAKAVVEKRLDALRDETRKPLDEWEAVEAARIAAEKLAFEIEVAHEAAIAENDLTNRARDLAAREAELARIEAERAAKEEADRAAQQAKEEVERAEAARIANEERIRKEAAEKAQKEEADRAAAQIAEAERKAAESKAAAEKAERDRVAAEIKAKEDQAAAVAAAEEKARQEAARVEAERVAKERAATEKAEAEKKEAERKAADVEHRRTINKEAVATLVANSGLTEKQAQNAIGAIVGGLVSHVRINY